MGIDAGKLRVRALHASDALDTFEESLEARETALAAWQGADKPSDELEAMLAFRSDVCDNMAAEAAFMYDRMEVEKGAVPPDADADGWMDRLDDITADLLDGKVEAYRKEVRECLAIGREAMRLPDVPESATGLEMEGVSL